VATPGMEYGGFKGAAPLVSMAGESEGWRRAGAWRISADGCPSRARCGFCCALERGQHISVRNSSGLLERLKYVSTR
jgi:hypothetical protein